MRPMPWLRRLTAASLSVMVNPAAGGKITSLLSTDGGREWLWTDPVRPLSRRPASGDFADHELSGWDECFPTIGPCRYPGTAEVGGPALSDHGDLWRQPWRDVSAGTDEIALEVDGGPLPYRFARTIRLDGHGLRLDYRVDNLGTEALHCLWSMHPLLRAEPGMRIRLDGHPVLTKEFGFGGRVGDHDGPDGAGGRFTEHHWPVVEGVQGASDLSRLDFPDPPVTDKVVARNLAVGRIELQDPASGQALALSWDAALIPFCGICINMGAWPFGDKPQRWVALEPSTGGTDRLDDAHRRGEAVIIPARMHSEWSVHIEVRGLPRNVVSRGREQVLDP